MDASLQELRAALDDVDRRIVEALAERHRLVARVADAKKGKESPRDEERESEVLVRVERQALEAGLDPRHVAALFRDIMEHSVQAQDRRMAAAQGVRPGTRLRVGYQGSAGAYSYLAAFQHFAGRRADLDCRGFRNFHEMTEAVEKGQLDYAMLPVENTTAGSINQAYDLLARAELAAVGEEVFHVDHCLVALGPIPLTDIRRIASHPQALEQCSEFIATLPGCEIEAYVDTAMAVGKIVRDRDPAQAAIASHEAARRHGLEILRRGIANQKENYTRFLVVAPDPEPRPPGTPCKTSLVFATLHEKGALARCLELFAEHDLNLTKLESRPRPNMPWEYLFYVDFEGNVAEPDTAAAIDELGRRTSFLKVLGSYPIHPASRAAG